MFTWFSRRVLIVVSCALAALASASADVPSVPGHIIVAKPTGDAVIIWDCSDVVAGIVGAKTPDADANAALERDAADALIEKLPRLEATMKTVTVKIVYQKTGAVSPVYGTSTFAGVEHYATLTLGKDAPSDRAALAGALGARSLPPWAVYTVTGTLPPRT